MQLYAVIPQLLGKDNSPTFAGQTITGNSVFGLNSSVFQPAADSTTFVQVKNAAGAIVGNFDTTNIRFGIGTAAPRYNLDIFETVENTYATSSASLSTPAGNILRLINTNNHDGQYAGIVIGSQNDNGDTAQPYIGTVATSTNYDSPLIFGRRTGSSDYQESMRIDGDGNVGIGEIAPETLIELSHATPTITGHCTTHTDSADARAVTFQAFGEQSGGEETTLGKLVFAHDGSADDEKGYIDGYTNSGSDGDSPTKQIRIQSTGDWVINKTSGIGIKVDLTAPTFGWRDLLGEPTTKNTGATKPSYEAYNGAIDGFRYSNGDEEQHEYHIPHDYVPGTDIYLHVHWSQISATNTGGTIDFKYFAIYSKGHNQAAFTSTPITDTVTSADAGSTQYQHFITEQIISGASATAALFDRDDIEPDGVILLTLEMDANNLTDSAAVTDPFIHFVDIHYRSTNIATKAKEPNFYT